MRTPTAVAIALAVLAAIGVAVWRGELWSVQRSGVAPAPLVALAQDQRVPVRFDVVLPTVPTGMRRLRDHDGAVLIHYWAPWEGGSRAQSHQLDSLAHAPGLERLTILLVCFDPFPSVARFVGRERLQLPVMLDGEHRLARVLPCASIPTTYLIDAAGVIRVRQTGAVDWLDRATRAVIEDVLAHPATPLSPPDSVALRTVETRRTT